MTIDKCELIFENVKFLSKSDVQLLQKKLRQKIKAERAKQHLDNDSISIEAAKEMASNILLNFHIEKRNELKNLIIRHRIMRTIASEFPESPARGLQALLVGDQKIARAGRMSVHARAKAIIESTFGHFINEVEGRGLLEHLNTGALDRMIAREMWEIGREGGSPGLTKNKAAQDIAELLDKYQEQMLSRLNRAGAHIKKRPGYIVRQTHDMFKIRAAGFENWKANILPKLADETFEHLESGEIDDFLGSVYRGLSTGIHYKIAHAGHEEDLAKGFLDQFVGPANLAKKLSQDRVLHFKSADDWMDYNEAFGLGNMREGFIAGMERAANSIALMETLGTNPRAMFDKIRSDLIKENRRSPKIEDELRDSKLDNFFKEVTGETRVPGNVNIAVFGSILRAIQNMSKLGGATLSAITDVPFLAAELRHQGMGAFDGYALALGNIFRGLGDRKGREFGRLLGVGMDGMRGEIYSRFGATDALPGHISRAQNLFFKMNVLQWWTDAHKRGFGMAMSRDLAQHHKKKFAELPDATKDLLLRYDVSEAEWDLLGSKKLNKFKDIEMFTADLVDDISIEEAAQILGRKKISKDRFFEYTDDLKTKITAMFVDRADFAIPTPGAREYALMRQGSRPGTALGEFIRFFMQFKAFPITVMTKPIARELYSDGAQNLMQAMIRGKARYGALAHMIAATTVMGYAAQSAKQLTKGREPRDPHDPKTWIAAAWQGGGFGLYGDFLFGEFDRFGRSAVASFSGPTFALVDDLANIYTRFRNGDDAAAQFVRTMVNNTPFINLFYTRIALDYLILYNIQEMLNPGYLRRLESRFISENDQKFLVPPSQVIKPGGGL